MQSESATSTTTPYNVDAWGEGYFRIAADGQLMVRPCPEHSHQEASLAAVRDACREQGLRTPILVRFSGILRHRVRLLADAFNEAIRNHHYSGHYHVVYPIKVNQQRRVVHELLDATDSANRAGLEAGSRPELLAVMALSREPGNIIICNGYKDRSYIRLALMAKKLGFQVYLVVEKLSELELILSEAEDLQVDPDIGLRVRLLSIGDGNWQNTGGEKSKFGLSAPQLEQAVTICREAGQLAALQMLHFHLGSQVPNIRDIQAGMQEASRYYQELRLAGAPLTLMDVGGGLGVDYEGTHSRSFCSMNYGLAEYADLIVRTLQDACTTMDLPEPDLISESGRALTAHHAVLLTRIIDREVLPNTAPTPPRAEQPAALQRLWQLHEQTNTTPNALEVHEELLTAWDEVRTHFLHQGLSLAHRSQAEVIYTHALERLRKQLRSDRRLHRALLETLNERLAEKLFVNFSIFQSLPDVWGINQVFPVLPLRGLNQEPERKVVIRDISCDSDGRMDRYADVEGLEATLSLPADHDNDLAFFMVGAYQEILGDMHNLFGDTDAVDVEIQGDGSVSLDHPRGGDTVSDVLRYVDYEPDGLLTDLEHHCKRAHLTADERQAFISEMRSELKSYTYLQ